MMIVSIALFSLLLIRIFGELSEKLIQFPFDYRVRKTSGVIIQYNIIKVNYTETPQSVGSIVTVRSVPARGVFVRTLSGQSQAVEAIALTACAKMSALCSIHDNRILHMNSIVCVHHVAVNSDFQTKIFEYQTSQKQKRQGVPPFCTNLKSAAPCPGFDALAP